MKTLMILAAFSLGAVAMAGENPGSTPSTGQNDTATCNASSDRHAGHEGSSGVDWTAPPVAGPAAPAN